MNRVIKFKRGYCKNIKKLYDFDELETKMLFDEMNKYLDVVRGRNYDNYEKRSIEQ